MLHRFYGTNNALFIAIDNYNAIQAFLDRFPRFRGNDFYIGGESYVSIQTHAARSKIGPYCEQNIHIILLDKDKNFADAWRMI